MPLCLLSALLALIGKLVDPSGRLPEMAIPVPGGVHSALLANKEIPDPYFGTNEHLCAWVAHQPWTIEVELDAQPSVARAPHVVLRLEDVDTVADLSLNGTRIGRTSNRFRRYDFDVTGLVRAGRNVLRADFKSVYDEMDKAAASLDHCYPVHGPVLQNLNLVRKPFCHGGWDWGPAILNVGFASEPKFAAADPARIDYVITRQSHRDDVVDVEVTIETFSSCDCQTNLVLSLGGVTDVSEVVLKKGQNRLVRTISVREPRLWWPVGMGAQNLYGLKVELDGASFSKRIGLRTIELVNEGDDVGRAMYFKVNGRRSFIKGADWIPCDALEDRQTPDRYRNLLTSAVRANMNAVRVWGGGQYEREVFYELCDELGLLVWQDFMFACATYPGADAFLSDIAREAEHQVRRLKDHPCIAVWCGDNECARGHQDWYPKITKEERAVLAAEYRKRLAVLGKVVSTFDPDRVFWPSSPYPGFGDPATTPTCVTSGDEHNWDVWHGDMDFEHYRDSVPRFASEFGYQSLSSPSVVQSFMGEGPVDLDSPLFQHHQKDCGGNDRIKRMISRYFKPPTEAEDILYLSQIQQAWAIKTGVECWRTSQPHCMGTLVWQLNDNWPVASWSSIEYGGRWKPMHYFLRRAYAPLTVQAVPGKRSVEVRSANDGMEMKGRLTLEYWSFRGEIVKSETVGVSVEHGSCVLKELADISKIGEAENLFLVMRLEADGKAVTNEFLFARPKDCRLERAHVEWRDDCLYTDRPAFFVLADSDDVLPDNGFVLLPGRPIRFPVQPKYWYNKAVDRADDVLLPTTFSKRGS